MITQEVSLNLYARHLNIGMEAVGVVLGAIPLVISALRSYKDAKKFGGRFLNRKKHVEKLIRALQEQHGALQTIIIWLFKAIDEPYDDYETGSCFQDAIIRSKMIDYLGAEGFESFDLALKRAQQAVKQIARSIKEFLPESQPVEDTLKAVILMHSAEDERFKFQKSWKLSMGEGNVEEEIKELRESTSFLWQMQNMGVSMRQMEALTPLKSSKKLTDSLIRIQNHARHLYKAISVGWTPGCHSTHEVRLVLEDRLETVAAASMYPKSSQKRPLDFNIIFVSENISVCDLLLHEGRIRVIEGDWDLKSLPITESSIPPHITSRPTVTFSLIPDPNDARPSTQEVNDICLTICQAKQEKKTLDFYLSLQQRLHCCQPFCRADVVAPTQFPTQFARTVSLQAILTKTASTSDRSMKLPLKPRLFLALILASTLIQLNATPWLTSCWSNESIHFSSPSQAIDSSQIDLKRPLLTREFQNPPSATGIPQHQPGPREMILELGIMLLELGHEITLVDHFSGTGYVINRDYHTRLSLATRWLDESEPYLTPTYFDVTARCIRCHFDGIPYLPVWNDALFRALAQYVIDPLREQCRPRQRI